MKEKESALYSQYIIDGIRCDATPAELLEECLEFPDGMDEDSTEFDDIIDVRIVRQPQNIIIGDPGFLLWHAQSFATK